MGVPKFFRYISERYPCLSQLVLESEIPDFDNLYLDMNGIIHNCSHPNDFDPHFRITEEKIFKDIFHYIEMLFRIIKPRKLFFMAIDGVAPRAKMNQQRGRRFRSAKDAEDQEKAVLRKGEKLPDMQRFDSNCITPGTSFMARLQAQLQYFISLKVSTDKGWQKVEVILSGHECPGEGEHKIMDYIRFMRSKLDYDPNTRHCLYGLDADLIMLGLCTHEPHFALLREEVKFGRKQQSKKINSPEDTKFFLLHLSLLREYLEMEFSSLKVTLNFKFDLENIIDDWVLMGFLVGNDFIPHLPGLHISSGALPILYKVYCEVLPTLNGYLNEGGILNLANFEAYMKKLASFDFKQFRDIYDDLKYLKQKSGNNQPQEISEDSVGFSKKLEPFYDSDDLEGDEELPNNNDNDFVQGVLSMMDLDDDDDSDYYEEENREENRIAFFQEFYLHKQNYYEDKLEYKNISSDELRGQAEGYIKALQWNLHYYYNGICSWSWFYPHHYAPFISDIQHFKNINLEYELGSPFLPFEQLLAVLPSLSKDLLPEPFQELMTDENSPILEYYPTTFETDLNGKKNDWEAVVLIPFIDENRLLSAMKSCYHRLTDEEKQRNKHGPMLLFNYTEMDLGKLEAPAYFSPVEKNHANEIPIFRQEIIVPREKLRKGILPGVRMDIYFPGFPTFKHLKYTSSLVPQGVKVFQSSSQGVNMIVKITKEENEPVFEELVPLFVNHIVHVSWPYLTEAKVVGISSRDKKCFVEGGICRVVGEDDDVKSFMSDVNSVKQEFLKSRGIDVGITEYLLQVKTFEGKKFVFNQGNKISLEKKWSNKIHSYPLQSVVTQVCSTTSFVTDITIDDIFSLGCNCFLLNKDYYGCLGIVNDRSENGHVKIKVNKPPEPEQHHLRIERTSISYYSNNEAAHRASIPNHLLARITGTILVLDTDSVLDSDKCPKVNIGLNLKFSRRNQLLPGYTKRTEQNQWLYSDKTVALIREYADSFPEVIRYLAENSDKDNIFRNDLFPLPGQSHMLSVISNWLDGKSELKSERRACDAELLEEDVIANLESKIEYFMKKNKRGLYVNLKAKPFHLYIPSSQIEKQPPDNAKCQLLDRVVNVRDNFVVPLGYRGTIIGIEKQQQDKAITYCDILFDQSFPSAFQYHTKKKRVYKLPDKCLLNITYAKKNREREEGKKTPQKYVVPDRNPNTPVQNRSALANNQHYLKPTTVNHGRLPVSQSYASVANPNITQYASNSLMLSPGLSPIVYQHQGQPSASYMEVPYGVPANVPYQTPTNFEKAKSSSLQGKKVSKGVASSAVNAPSAGLEEKETTLALKKLLRISNENNDLPESTKTQKSKEEKAHSTDEKNERGYVIELQELLQKAGKSNPKYEYQHVDGNFRAILHIPGTEMCVTSELASTKKMAGEKAAFTILKLLELVQNFGDKVRPMPPSEDSSLDLNLLFLRMQQKLPEAPWQNSPQLSFSMQQEQNSLQSIWRSQIQQQQQQQQQKFQMLLNTQPQQPAVSLPQQMYRPVQQYSHPMSPFQPPRQMTLATNFIYQQNMPSKYSLPPQQLYYQNVQNFYYNQPTVRTSYSAPTAMPPQQWFPPIMPQPSIINPGPSVQPRPYYSDQVPAHLSHSADKSVFQNVNYYASSSQTAFTPTGPVVTQAPKIAIETSRTSHTEQQSTCSGRVSKTPKKSRLAANFATKAAT